jgi:DNA-binding MarR family transcriptional regulator
MHIMMPSPDPSMIEYLDCLCLASRRASRTITRAFERQLRPWGIKATQFSMLTLLIGHGQMTIGELADSLGLERTTLTRNLSVVEENGWVKIDVGDADGRSRVVSATAKGRKAVTAAMPAWHQAQAAAKAAIGQPGVDALHAVSRAALS